MMLVCWMPVEEPANQATKTQSAWSCFTLEWLIKWGSLRVCWTWRLPKRAVNDDIPVFLPQTCFSVNANKQMYHIPFSALEQLGCLYFYFCHPPFLCLFFGSNKRDVPGWKKWSTFFPLAFPVTLLSAPEFGKHGPLCRDGSEDIPEPPGAVCTKAYGFDGEEVCCGICGFCGGQNCELLSFSFLPLYNGTAFESVRGEEWAL